MSIRSHTSRELYPIAFYLMETREVTDQDLHKARKAFKEKISDVVFEHETGLPAISQWMAPADQLK